MDCRQGTFPANYDSCTMTTDGQRIHLTRQPINTPPNPVASSILYYSIGSRYRSYLRRLPLDLNCDHISALLLNSRDCNIKVNWSWSSLSHYYYAWTEAVSSLSVDNSRGSSKISAQYMIISPMLSEIHRLRHELCLAATTTPAEPSAGTEHVSDGLVNDRFSHSISQSLLVSFLIKCIKSSNSRVQCFSITLSLFAPSFSEHPTSFTTDSPCSRYLLSRSLLHFLTMPWVLEFRFLRGNMMLSTMITVVMRQ